MLKYSLRKNLLTGKANEYTACVIGTRAYSLDEIVERIVRRGSAMTSTDIQAVLRLFGEEMSAIIADGGSVNTPFVNSSFSICGVFAHADDTFDRSCHTLQVHLTPGTLLKEALRRVKAEKAEAPRVEPVITEAGDVASGTVNSVLSAGGVLRLAGRRLKFEAGDERQGVFLVGEDAAVQRCAVVVEVLPSRVTVVIPPQLAAGIYSLELRTMLDVNGRPSKRLRTGRLANPLVVSEAGACKAFLHNKNNAP